MCIKDNGSGLPEKFEIRMEASMGMELLQGLCDDLGGCLDIVTKNGTRIELVFDTKSVPVHSLSYH